MDVEVEDRLIASCRAGDKSAYADLVRVYSGRVFAVCLGMLSNRQDAEDVAQQTLLRGFVQIRTLRDSQRFGAWITGIARNLCIDTIRQRKRRVAPVPGPECNGDPEVRDYRRLEAALARLASEYRVPLLLFYFDGRSTQNIAEMLGLTPANVQTRLSRARKQLRRLLEREGDDR